MHNGQEKMAREWNNVSNALMTQSTTNYDT